VLRDAHDATLTSLHFFAGEPRLMSAAADNSVKQWLFDNADGSGRLLRFRSGHAAPPSCLRYYGDGTRLLSAGLQRCRNICMLQALCSGRHGMAYHDHPAMS
jgi:U3 small nucleolar RNA-associated protein 21